MLLAVRGYIHCFVEFPQSTDFPFNTFLYLEINIKSKQWNKLVAASKIHVAIQSKSSKRFSRVYTSLNFGCFKYNEVVLELSLQCTFNPFQDKSFRGCCQSKSPSLPKFYGTYSTVMEFDMVPPYLKKIQKILKTHPLSSADTSTFLR